MTFPVASGVIYRPVALAADTDVQNLTFLLQGTKPRLISTNQALSSAGLSGRITAVLVQSQTNILIFLGLFLGYDSEKGNNSMCLCCLTELHSAAVFHLSFPQWKALYQL